MTFYSWLYGVRHMVKDNSYSERGYPLLPHGLLVFLYAASNKQDSIYHSLCYTSHGPLVGTRNSSRGAPRGIDLKTHHTINGCSTTELHLTPDDSVSNEFVKCQFRLITDHVIKLFNDILVLGYFPPKWAH